jgi:hypothetical protein
MPNFQIAIERPEEIIPRLGKQEAHWKKGRSAYELATAWMTAGTFPPAIRTVLDQAEEWRGAVLLEAVFERETELGTRGRPSQTDLLCIVRLAQENAILGIEGKVDEPFGSRVKEWLADDAAGGRRARLESLCATLGVDANAPAIGDLFYQLFHRTCATVYEAQRFRYPHGLMLVHSFSDAGAWFPEFAAFAQWVGMPVAQPNTLSPIKTCAGVQMRLGWVSDAVSP